MTAISRRSYLGGVLGTAAVASLPARLRAQARTASIPPEGIGHNIRHLSYSDQGGRPDGVQIIIYDKD